MTAKLFWIAAAGALGTLMRYGLSGVAQNLSKGVFAWGTLAVNLVGCLLFGIIWSAATERWAVSSEIRAVVLIGFLGAFTTFSSFAFETSQLLRDAQWLLAVVNLTAHNVGGLLAILAGLALGRLL